MSKSRRAIAVRSVVCAVGLLVLGQRAYAAPLAVASATSGTKYSATVGPSNAVDGYGWTPATDTHSTINWDKHFLSGLNPALAARWIRVTFDTSRTVRSMKLWNYNESDANTTARGLWTATLAYSSDNGANWTDIETFDFRPGWTTSGYTPEIRTFAPVTATDMKLYNWTNFYGSGYYGIAEFQFFTEALTNNYTKILPGGIITRVAATASDRYAGVTEADAMRMVDGTGLIGGVASNSQHAAGWNGTHWLNNGLDAARTWAKFDLGAVYVINRMRVWNYNESDGKRGITNFNIYVSATGTGNPVNNPANWTLTITGQKLQLAPGNAKVSGQNVPLSVPAGTRYVAFANMLNGGASLRGLSEVQFYGSAPRPPSRGTVILID